MARLLGWTAAAALVLVVAAFVPIGGRTLLERWRSAPDPGALVDGTWKKVGAGWDRLWGEPPETRRSGPRVASRPAAASRPAQRAPAGRPAPAAGRQPAAEPVEHHTEADRSAVDRIVAEHVR